MPPRLRKEDKKKENSHTRTHLMPLWTPFSQGGCRRADSCGFNGPRLRAGFEECLLLLCAAGTHMKDDRGERERHKPFPPSLRSKEKQNLPAPPSKETPRSQVCRKIFSFLALKNVGVDVRPVFWQRWPESESFHWTLWHNKTWTRACPYRPCASHTLPNSPSFSRSFHSCTLSAFGAVLSYTILRRATRPPF